MSVPAIGLTCSDQRHPGSNVIRITCPPPMSITSARPWGISRTSVASSNPRCSLVMADPFHKLTSRTVAPSSPSVNSASSRSLRPGLLTAARRGGCRPRLFRKMAEPPSRQEDGGMAGAGCQFLLFVAVVVDHDCEVGSWEVVPVRQRGGRGRSSLWIVGHREPGNRDDSDNARVRGCG